MTDRAAERLIVALDTPTLREAVRLATKLRGLVRYVKIGSILFAAAGPQAIRRVRGMGFEVFVDLKFHDIPSTVEKSCRALVPHQPFMLTVHASGGKAMVQAAVRGVREEAARLRLRRPQVVAVTVLTSDGSSSGSRRVARQVGALARCAKTAGCDGVVASVHEAAMIRRLVRRPFLIVCPGIRAEGAAVFDQARVATPREAIRQGADWLVVGRPITQAKDPPAAARQMLNGIRSSSRC